MAQHDQKLQESGVGLIRMDIEYLGRLISRRNIETWIPYLNELSDFKGSRNNWTDLIQPAAERLYAWTRSNIRVPGNCVPSLQHGGAELLRLDFRAE
jgi:hypothetical protein